jgi:hypothetical protein
MNNLQRADERILDRSRDNIIKICEQSAEMMERLAGTSTDPLRTKKLQALAKDQKECAVRLRQRRQSKSQTTPDFSSVISGII